MTNKEQQREFIYHIVALEGPIARSELVKLGEKAGLKVSEINASVRHLTENNHLLFNSEMRLECKKEIVKHSAEFECYDSVKEILVKSSFLYEEVDDKIFVTLDSSRFKHDELERTIFKKLREVMPHRFKKNKGKYYRLSRSIPASSGTRRYELYSEDISAIIPKKFAV